MNRFSMSRGNAVPETALTMGLVLLLLLGLVKLSLVGYEQSEADGAAFVAARAASLTTDPTQQAGRGASHAEGVFSTFPTNNLNIAPGSSGTGPNGTGEVVSSAYRLTSGLFSGSFGTGQFDLKSHIVEPVIGSGSIPPPLQITQSNLTNCVPTNPATPNCTSSVAQIYLPVYDPTNKNPYWQYDCHLAAFAVLSNGTGGTGTLPGLHPWPEDYQPTTPGSINWPALRATGIYLNSNGTLGSALAPIYAWSSTNPC